MENFKLNRIKNKFIWESNSLAIEFSNPKTQGFSDYITLTKEEQILYYYYTVSIFKKVENSYYAKSKVLVSKITTHDFPNILQFKELLVSILNNNPIIDGQKTEYENGIIEYSKTMSTNKSFFDDYYEVVKIVNSNDNKELYQIYFGNSYGLQCGYNSVGIKTYFIEKESVEQLIQCVSNFIQYSLEEHNRIIKFWSSVYELKNEKIYQYNLENEKINKEVLESIFAVNDRVNITTVVNNEEKDFDNVVITKIDGNNITVNNKEIINFADIVHMCNEPTEAMLTYNVNQIKKDFFNILNETEKEEFKNSEIDDLFKKYKMAIIDRTWMCRDEHCFDINYKQGNVIKEISPVVKGIIMEIKNELK